MDWNELLKVLSSLSDEHNTLSKPIRVLIEDCYYTLNLCQNVSTGEFLFIPLEEKNE